MKKSTIKKINLALLAGALTASIAVGGLAACSNKSGGEGSVSALPSVYSFKASAIGCGETYYVAPDVAYGSGSGTEADPYNISWILTYNMTPLKAGDTVLLKPGVYKQSSRIRIETTGVSGEQNAYITVKNSSSTEKAILDFYDLKFDGNNRGVQLDTDYWYWYGIDIRGAGDNGMYIGGSYNVIENCEFYDNRDTGLQLGRSDGAYNNIQDWPSYNLIKNCTSYNNYDDETYGENADGFAAKLTVGYGNIFDGCIAYRNSDDGWDLYAKTDSGNIGAVIIYNCIAFENGYLAETQEEFHEKFPQYSHSFDEPNTNSYLTRDGDGNGFKLGGSVMEGDVYMYNCLSFNNRMHGVTDNSNPGVLSIKNVTAYNNSAPIDDDPDSSTFGEIVLEGAGVDLTNKNGNINLSRQEYSYNLMSHILSVTKDSESISADEYRGSVEYSYFDMGAKKANKIETCVDASDRAEAYAVKGTNTSAVSANIFAELPATWTKDGSSVTYTYNLSGKGNSTVHADMRNADGSINTGNLFKVTDYSALFGDEHKIGSDLSKTNWDAYEHYSYYNASNASSKADAAVKSAIATLDLNTNVNATFQDFDLLVKMEDVNITWKSSDESIIKINTDTYLSPSGTQDARAIVYRQAEDVKVYLTAKVTHRDNPSVSMSKRFEITVKKDVPTIGEAIFADVEDGRIILDMFDTVREPEMVILNAADYNGKILDPSLYTVETIVEYAENKNSFASEIHHFSTNIAGVHTIYKKIRMGESSKTFSYTIYVASSAADVDFVGAPTVMVNQHGYSISGEVSSPTGKLYAYSTDAKIGNPTAAQIISDGQLYEFRDDKINFQFENTNEKGYFIYYVMTNLNDEVTSEVGKIPVETEDIDTVEDFKDVILNSDPSKIYKLTKDIDLSGEKNWVSDITEKKKPFQGVLNGMGHTISGLSVTVSGNQNELGGMFYKVAGGTIENVKFKDIYIKGNEKTAIVATTEGGYFYNISMENVNIVGSARVGGLIGQASTGDLYVDQVSLVNPVEYVKATEIDTLNFVKTGYYTKSDVEGHDVYTLQSEYVEGTEYYTRKMFITGARSGGIIGFIQASNQDSVTRTYISNCYVDSTIGSLGEQYQGGIVGSADDRNAKDWLQIDNCYSVATVVGKTYVGGVLGSHNKGTGKLRINNSLFFGTLYYSSDFSASLNTAQKNCSGIVGRYIANADAVVSNCYTFLEEHNSNFDVNAEAYQQGTMYGLNFWQRRLVFDTTAKWTLVRDGNLVVDPFITWNFLGEWD
ncbi:MAG: right-handed parallel beta-helix repeat-containing protein [Clostridiales bacterium]|nr:right-handed parallel beta-helix repeat-containing protein [Clostridiales bacterium]